MTVEQIQLIPRLSPSGRLSLLAGAQATAFGAPTLDAPLAERLLAAFEAGPGDGLLLLVGEALNTPLPPVFGWWRAFARRYINAVCTAGERQAGALPPPADLDTVAPPMLGAEYLSPQALSALWTQLDQTFCAALDQSGLELQPFLRTLNPAWNVVGRVHFNLAENRRDAGYPFAFLATYTTRLAAHGRAEHKALGQALREYAATTDKGQLLTLLMPVQQAAERCRWLKKMVDSGEIFHPLRWSATEAFDFLHEVPALEQAGVIVRMPAGWTSGRPPRPKVNATVGAKAPSTLGQAALLDFQVELSLDGDPLNEAEVEAILSGTRGLTLLRGRWVELDPERLQRTLAHFQDVDRRAAAEGLPFGEAMRRLAGADIEEAANDPEWAGVMAGPWLSRTLQELRAPGSLAANAAPPGLRGTLRPYQQVGLGWLQLLSGLGLGACLADDMGLGKTIQILALLLARRQKSPKPSLLVAPASLLGNWAAEIERFTPELRARVAHSSAMPVEQLKGLQAADFATTDLVITSYGSLLRLPWVTETQWDLVILDEAQAIKNPGTKQTRAAKRLRAHARISLTGTPIENRLGDLWSLFDFINPGLLGSGRHFTRYTKSLGEKGPSRGENPYGPLRQLVGPYILRRLKTDRSVIADLPDKTELKAYCPLSRPQAALYQQSVIELESLLGSVEGMERRGLVLSFLLRFKQICNHPSQWLGDGAWAPADSGKWGRLQELCEVIAERQDKVLIFTQFTEIIPPLASFLSGIFGRPGLILTGDTAVKGRQELVRRFQEDEGVPFFLLSLKAGGSGLNLTAASHVVHFDRWWNPAVENQATDRAFRIGQSKNVLVHKFVCRGTVEDRIDALIESKKQLSEDILEGGGEVKLTELNDAELLRLVSLDLHSALGE